MKLHELLINHFKCQFSFLNFKIVNLSLSALTYMFIIFQNDFGENLQIIDFHTMYAYLVEKNITEKEPNVQCFYFGLF